MSGQVFAMLVWVGVCGLFNPRAGFAVLIWTAGVIYLGGPW